MIGLVLMFKETLDTTKGKINIEVDIGNKSIYFIQDKKKRKLTV